MLRKIFLVIALIIIFISLAGCQTVQGAGRDIEWIGQKGSEIVD
jgi:predicted small secreted protein